MGRPDWLGASQAMATIAQICSAVIFDGLPERGASRRRSSMPRSARGIGCRSVQRWRQIRTMSRVICCAAAMAVLLSPSAASMMI